MGRQARMAESAAAPRPLRVLFIHHCGAFSGASRSLWELISAFPASAVEPWVLAPTGRTLQVFASAGIRCIPSNNLSIFDNTRYGYYRGLRWLILLRELARLPGTYRCLRRALGECPPIDLVHVNDITMLYAIAMLAKRLRVPVVVHVRGVQSRRQGWPGRLVTRVLERRARSLIAIDETVKRSLPPSLMPRATVIHNGFQPSVGDQEASVAQLPLVVAMVGNLIRAKGCREFVEAADLCKKEKLRVRFVFVGAGAGAPPSWWARQLVRVGVAQSIEHELRDTVTRLGLEDTVEFRPFTTDLATVYRSIQVICFPSHLDAPGRPIFEAAFFAVPSIVAIANPTADTFVDGETGIRIDAGSATEIVTAVRRLAQDPGERRRLGRNAQALARRNFDAGRNASAVLELYRRVLS